MGNRSRWCKVCFLAAAAMAAAGTAAAAENSCGTEDRPPNYHQQPGDVSSSTRFTGTRELGAAHSVEVDVCAGELRLVHSPAATQVQLTITSSGADRDLAHYLQDFEVQGGQLRVGVRIPSNYHATVTLTLPAGNDRTSQINLGAGTLVVRADALGGNRTLNVGAGTASLFLDGNRDYASLEANVGMGLLQDDLPGGHSSFLVVHRESSGSGKGRLQINVGAGKIELEPAPQ